MIEQSQATFTRSTLAEHVGVNIETLRFYEKKGLLLPAFRDSSNYRRYGKEAAKRVRIIRSAKELGFSLAEIASFLELFEIEENPCPSARAQTIAKIDLIDGKIEELGKLKNELEALVESCERKEPSGCCAILDRLENAD